MKRLLAVMASSFFVAGVSATDIYHGLGDGNSDLSTPRLSASDFAGVQPGVGDSVSRYQGWADGNPDLFKADRSGPNGAHPQGSTASTDPTMSAAEAICNDRRSEVVVDAGVVPPVKVITWPGRTAPVGFRRGRGTRSSSPTPPLR